jgi:hypothetical protein
MVSSSVIFTSQFYEIIFLKCHCWFRTVGSQSVQVCLEVLNRRMTSLRNNKHEKLNFYTHTYTEMLKIEVEIVLSISSAADYSGNLDSFS